MDDLVAVTLTCGGMVADQRVDGEQLVRVTFAGARGMGADEVDALGARGRP